MVKEVRVRPENLLPRQKEIIHSIELAEQPVFQPPRKVRKKKKKIDASERDSSERGIMAYILMILAIVLGVAVIASNWLECVGEMITDSTLTLIMGIVIIILLEILRNRPVKVTRIHTKEEVARVQYPEEMFTLKEQPTQPAAPRHQFVPESQREIVRALALRPSGGAKADCLNCGKNKLFAYTNGSWVCGECGCIKDTQQPRVV